MEEKDEKKEEKKETDEEKAERLRAIELFRRERGDEFVGLEDRGVVHIPDVIPHLAPPPAVDLGTIVDESFIHMAREKLEKMHRSRKAAEEEAKKEAKRLAEEEKERIRLESFEIPFLFGDEEPEVFTMSDIEEEEPAHTSPPAPPLPPPTSPLLRPTTPKPIPAPPVFTSGLTPIPAHTKPSVPSTKPSVPSTKTPVTGLSLVTPSPSTSPEEKKIEEIKGSIDEEKELKDNFDLLDKDSKDFYTNYFKADQRQIAAHLLGRNVLKIKNEDFLKNLAAEFDEDLKTNEKIRDAANFWGIKDAANLSLTTVNPIATQRLIDIYMRAGEVPLLNYRFQYDPSGSAILKPQDIENIRNIENIVGMSQERFLDEYIDLINQNDPSARDSDLKELEKIRKNMEMLKTNLRDGFMTEDEYKENAALLFSDLDAFKKDPLFVAAQTNSKVRSINDIKQFNNLLRAIDAYITPNKNTATGMVIQNKVRKVIQDVKDGAIDLAKAYKILSKTEPIKQALIDREPDADKYEIKLEEREEEELLEKDKESYEEISKFYKGVQKSNLLGVAGFSIPSLKSVVKDENVYDLSVPEYETLIKNIDGELPSDFATFKIGKKTKIEDIVDWAGEGIKVLKNAGVMLDPEYIPLLKDIDNKDADPEEMKKHAKTFQSDVKLFLKSASEARNEKDKLENDKEYNLKEGTKKINEKYGAYSEQIQKEINDKIDDSIVKNLAKLDKDYQTLIDKEGDEDKKTELATKRDELKKEEEIRLNTIRKKELEEADKVMNEKWKKELDGLPDKIEKPISKLYENKIKKINKSLPKRKTRMVKRTKPVAVKKVRREVGEHRIIIRPSEYKEKAKPIQERAKQAMYAAKTREHEPESGKSYYGKYTIEYRVQDDKDLVNMIRDIRAMKGELYIIDGRTGRLFPIDPKDAVKGAHYIFHISADLKGNKLIQHGSHAFYPVLDKIKRDEQKLFPLLFMQNGNDKILQRLHMLPSAKNNFDYTDQMRIATGGSLWKVVKKGLQSGAKEFGNYLVNETVDAAKNFGKQSVYEAKNLAQQEIQAAKNIYNTNRKFYANPSVGRFGKAVGNTLANTGKILYQPALSATRELANTSDFIGDVPGLGVAKFALKYAVPPIGIADSAVHAVKNIDDKKYLDGAINTLDAVLGTNKLSGVVDTGTKLLNTGLKIADVITDRENH